MLPLAAKLQAERAVVEDVRTLLSETDPAIPKMVELIRRIEDIAGPTGQEKAA